MLPGNHTGFGTAGEGIKGTDAQAHKWLCEPCTGGGVTLTWADGHFRHFLRAAGWQKMGMGEQLEDRGANELPAMIIQERLHERLN